MRITVTEIEATAEDLRANRTIADAFADMVCRIGEIISPNVRQRTVEEEETEDGE